MAFFAWQDSLNTGVDMVDSQHRKLVDMLNELYDSMQKGQAKDKLDGIMDRLYQYTREHFSAEEDFLRQRQYPDLVAHQTKHRLMTEHVLELRARINTGNCSVIEFSNFLKDWLKKHIAGTDMQYAEYLRKQA